MDTELSLEASPKNVTETELPQKSCTRTCEACENRRRSAELEKEADVLTVLTSGLAPTIKE